MVLLQGVGGLQLSEVPTERPSDMVSAPREDNDHSDRKMKSLK